MRIRLFGHFVHVPFAVLLLIEVVLFVASVHVAALLRRDPDVAVGSLEVWVTAIVFTAGALLAYASLGLYTPRQRAGIKGVVLRVLMAMAASFGLLAMAYFAIPTLKPGRGVVALALTMGAALSIIARLIFRRVVDIQGMKKRVLVYGQTEQMAEFMRLRRRSDRAGFVLVGIVHAAGDQMQPLGERVLEAPNGLRQLCIDQGIDELVVALRNRRQVLPSQDLMECKLAGVSVVEVVTFLERETGCIRLDMLNPSWMIFGAGFRRGGVRRFTTTVVDFLASVVLLIVASPAILLTMLAIWLEDGRKGAPVFYRQERVGLEGRLFQLIKFRSMRVDAEGNGQAQWASKNDPRVTRVGAFIRRTRIDELPQLINVLQGHMSFVGPRPERPQFVAELEAKIPFYAYRHTVKPGITGWAQLCYPYGASEEDAKHKLQYDLYYVKNNNLLMDLTILLQTVEVVFLGKGAR